MACGTAQFFTDSTCGDCKTGAVQSGII